jgi:DNA-binding Lrp family transcriptional regulator
MMLTAYVFVNCTIGSEERIIRQISELPEVKEVRGTYGVYDIFVKVKSLTTESLNDTIIYRIRKILGITSTLTLLVIRKQGGKG